MSSPTAGAPAPPELPSAAARLVGSFAFAAVFAGVAELLWHPTGRFYAYNVPIAVPFALFVIERLHAAWVVRDRRTWGGLGIDAAVILVALARVFYPPPGYSGHVLFLVYATAAARTTLTRVFASLVLVQVIVWKLGLSRDFVTPIGGLVLAAVATAVWRRLSSSIPRDGGPRRRPCRRTRPE